MNWKKIFAVIRREYLERVRTKAFWIATFLVPAFFLGYMAVQFASIRKTSGERRVAVVDLTGHLAQPLASELAEREVAHRKKTPGSPGIHWILEPRPVVGDVEKTKEALRKEVLDKKLYGYLVLDPTLLEKDRGQRLQVVGIALRALARQVLGVYDADRDRRLLDLNGVLPIGRHDYFFELRRYPRAGRILRVRGGRADRARG